jgi:hypothetical protein
MDLTLPETPRTSAEGMGANAVGNSATTRAPESKRAQARARKVRDQLRRTQMLDMRLQGLTFASIGEAFGTSGNNVEQIVARSLARAERRPAELLLKQEIEELERLRTRAMEILGAPHLRIEAGKPVQVNGRFLPDAAPTLRAIEVLLRIAERRARLLGLDAPAKVARTNAAGEDVPVAGMTWDELQAALPVALAALRGGQATSADVIDVDAVQVTEAGQGAEVQP